MNERGHTNLAGQGLLDSGVVVSVIRSAADLETAVLARERFITIAAPGNPCGTLLCCSIRGAEALSVALRTGLAQLCKEAAEQGPGA
jgi:hypothetical protein